MPPLRPLLIWPGLVAMVSVFVTMSALLVSALSGPHRGEIIHLSIHLWAWKPFIMRPETSINYSDGRKSEERQIHLDLIGEQVCSGLLSKFPLRWSLRDNGAKRERTAREKLRERRQGVRKMDIETLELCRIKDIEKNKRKQGPTSQRMTAIFLCSQSQHKGNYWLRLRGWSGWG